jgi:hypothetical protein
VSSKTPEEVAREAATRSVVEAFVKYWGVQDIERTVELHAEDAVSRVHFNHPEVGMSGEVRGREKIAEGLYENLAQWHYLSFEPTIMSIEGDTARVHIAFEYEHAKTSTRIASTQRMVVVVKNGLLSQVDSYYDVEKVAAFMRLLRWQQGKT